MRLVRVTAHALLSGIFVVSGARTFANPDRAVPHAKAVTERVGPVLAKIHPDIPTDTRSVVRINSAAQVVGGLLLATSHLTRPAAAMLAGTLVPTTLAAHSFWTIDDPAEQAQNQIHFLKNLGLLGGLLLTAVDTQGRPGVSWRAHHALTDGRRSLRRAMRTVRGGRPAMRSRSLRRLLG